MVDLPKPTNLMRGGQAWHCVFLLVSVIFDILRKIFKQLSKNCQKPGKLLCVTVFNAVIWLSWDPCITLAFYAVMWVLFSPFFMLMLCCRANVIGSCIAQPKIARIDSIASGVLWWQCATYASSCIMTKTFSGYHKQCTHFGCHILEGVWLLPLPKTDWDKSAQGGLESALELLSVLSF